MSRERLTAVTSWVRELIGRPGEAKPDLDPADSPAATRGDRAAAGAEALSPEPSHRGRGPRDAAGPAVLVEPKRRGAAGPGEPESPTDEPEPREPSERKQDGASVRAGCAGAHVDARREIVRRFEVWLERVMADEAPPEGIDAGILAAVAAETRSDGGGPTPDETNAGGDRAALWSAMTALSEEIRLQGRAFGRLDASLAPLGGWGEILSRIDQRQDALAASFEELAHGLRERSGADARRAAAEAERASLEVLFDLYARLERGMTACRGADALAPLAPPATPRRGWRRRLRPEVDQEAHLRGAVESLREGYALTLDRLRDALRRMDITPIDRPGAAFDAHTMSAVDVVECDAHAAGTVVEVYEPGFVRRDQVLRVARVRVAGAAPASDETGDDS